ncbi:MAG: alpha/beta hydrolase [Cytophagales bacterium]|nr:alpha/beta hydrolase [Cytophagales bacterium]MDW8383302.1 alpha/beta hydrolase [Flammeovirgaceae bacterium]
MYIQADTTLLLWQERPAFAKGNSETDIPKMQIFLSPPEINSKTGVIICPGGAYGRLSTEKEGREVALWLNTLGISAFVLHYRLGTNGYQHPVPLIDLQRAMVVVKQNAIRWNLDTAKIGVLGFSAGGHLTSTLGTHFDKLYYTPTEEKELSISVRPDFMMLVYPVITMQDSFTHNTSRKNLLGDIPSQELKNLLSNELQVTSQTPPTFITHTYDDASVPVENSLLFFEALRKAKVPAELHIYASGGHGYGLRRQLGVHAEWYKHAENWLRSSGFIK